MPIFHNVKNETFFGTVVKFGTGDVGMSGCVDENATPQPAMLIWQDVPKDLQNWGLEKGFTYDKSNMQLLKGHGVQLEFGRIESIDTLIKVLQEVRDQMFKRNNASRATNGD